jgi:glycosyltransferase involved in cell wall biosynthesis
VNGAQLNPGHGFKSKRIDQPPLTEPTSAKLPFRSPRNTIQCYLVCAVIFIFYSRFFDVYLTQYRIPAITLGLTALASLSRVGGNPELVIPGETGLLFDAGNSEELAGALLRLGESAPLRQQLAARASEFVRGRFPVAAAARRLEEIYGALLQAR